MVSLSFRLVLLTYMSFVMQIGQDSQQLEETHLANVYFLAQISSSSPPKNNQPFQDPVLKSNIQQWSVQLLNLQGFVICSKI